MLSELKLNFELLKKNPSIIIQLLPYLEMLIAIAT